MASRGNPTLIGAFVLGGLALFVIALFVLGGGRLLEKRSTWVAYFDGSVEGLAPGAAVTFRGVHVGSVIQVDLQLNTKTLQARIPVVFETDPSRVTYMNGTLPTVRDAEQMAKGGLRASLVQQSFVTGQRAIQLDLLPNTPYTLVGGDPNSPIIEVAVVKSDIEQLKDSFTNLPLRELVATTERTLLSVDRLASSPELQTGLAALVGALIQLNQETGPTLRDIATAAQTVQGAARQASQSVATLESDAHATLTDIRGLTNSVDQQVATSGQALLSSVQSARAALRQAELAMTAMNSLVAGNSALRADLERTLRNSAQASESLKEFARKIERSPNALVIGR